MLLQSFVESITYMPCNSTLYVLLLFQLVFIHTRKNIWLCGCSPLSTISILLGFPASNETKLTGDSTNPKFVHFVL